MDRRVTPRAIVGLSGGAFVAVGREAGSSPCLKVGAANRICCPGKRMARSEQSVRREKDFPPPRRQCRIRGE